MDIVVIDELIILPSIASKIIKTTKLYLMKIHKIAYLAFISANIFLRLSSNKRLVL